MFFSTVQNDSDLIRSDLRYMSQNLLGLPYEKLSALIYPKPRYQCFALRKKSGSYRIINVPSRDLKAIQRKILNYLYENSSPSRPCVHGFVKDRSIVTNAKKHCAPRTKYLLNIDISDFFPTISFYRIRGVFINKPFNFSYQNATVLAHICTFDGALPQGAPTSPYLANLVCRSLDKDLMGLAQRQRATYTRYCDDITFSFSTRKVENLPSSICSFDSGVLRIGDELNAIIATNSFVLNPDKSRLSSSRHRLEVTGLTINKFPNVKRIFIDQLRGALHAWEKYGYAKAAMAWEERSYKRQLRTRKIPSLKQVLRGKLLFLQMVRGKDDVLYTRFAEKYNNLCEKERANDLTFSFAQLPISPVVRCAEHAEEAVFVIEWMADYKGECIGGQGTAFAYKSIGLVTCDHVFKASTEKYGEVDFKDIIGAELQIINPTTGYSGKGKVERRDGHRDVAIIKFISPPPKTRHFTGLESVIDCHSNGFLIGFPNHSVGKKANQLTSTVINTFTQSGISRVEINGNIRKGNSGGPFVDEIFRVAGVAQQGSTQENGNDQCLCVTELDKWLAQT